jgi:hypothetical protein
LGNALGLLCFYLFVLHRFNIVSNVWKRFHMLVESYVQKKQLSTEYSVVRGRNGTPENSARLTSKNLRCYIGNWLEPFPKEPA